MKKILLVITFITGCTAQPTYYYATKQQCLPGHPSTCPGTPPTPAIAMGSEMARGWEPKKEDRSIVRARELVISRAKEAFPALKNIHDMSHRLITSDAAIKAVYGGSLKQIFGYRVQFKLSSTDEFGNYHFFQDVGRVVIRNDGNKESSVFCTANSKGISLPKFPIGGTLITEEYLYEGGVGELYTCQPL